MARARYRAPFLACIVLRWLATAQSGYSEKGAPRVVPSRNGAAVSIRWPFPTVIAVLLMFACLACTGPVGPQGEVGRQGPARLGTGWPSRATGGQLGSMERRGLQVPKAAWGRKENLGLAVNRANRGHKGRLGRRERWG